MKFYSKAVGVFLLLSLLVVSVLFAQTEIKTYTFDVSQEKWVSKDVSSIALYLTPPVFGYSDGQLSIYSPIQTDSNATNFGYWINDATDFSASDIPANSLLRGTFWVSTDQIDYTLVPQLRMALRNETANFNSLSQINSINNGGAAPIINTPTPTLQPFEHWFQPHDGSLYPDFDGLAVTFELINYFQDIAGPDEGTLFLDRVVIDRFDLSSAAFTSTQDFTLSLWDPDIRPNQAVGYYTCDFIRTPGGALALTPHDTGSPLQNTWCLGVWGGVLDQVSIDGLATSGAYLYRGVFNISADASAQTDVPFATVILQQKLVREGSALGISSNIDGLTAPDAIGKDYAVFFRPPAVEVTTAPLSDRFVFGEFQLLNFWLDDPVGTLYLNSAKLDRIDPDALP